MSEGFKAGTFKNAFKRSWQFRNMDWDVAYVLMDRMEYSGPFVTITKAQIARDRNMKPYKVNEDGREIYHLHRIKEALRNLREMGAIEPIYNVKGGRGNAVTYRLTINEKGVPLVQKGGTSGSERRYGQNPPTIYPIYSMSRRGSGQGAQQWRGGQAEKGGAGGNRRALTPDEVREQERFNLAMKLAGDYGGGKRLIAKWDAGEIPEGTLG